MKLDVWAVIGLKRWTISPHVDEINPNMTILPCFHFRFCYFQYSFDTSSCLHLSPRFSPSGLFFWLFAYEKMLNQRTEGKQGIQGGG